MVPLKTSSGSRPSSSLRIDRTRSTPGALRQPQVEHDEVDVGQVGADARQQLGRALDHDGLVPGVLDRRPEPVAHERRVVGDDDRLGRDRGRGHLEGIGTGQCNP